MRIKRICRLCTDMGMLIIMVLLMVSERTGIVLHMFLGVVLFVLFVVHNVLNLSWWAGIGKGAYSRTRWVRTKVNVFLLIDFLVVIISGIMYAALLHRVTALLFLVLTMIHIGGHWKKDSAGSKN